MKRRRCGLSLCSVVVVLTSILTGPAAGAATKPKPAVLVFSATTAFRHDSIPAAVAAIQALGTSHGYRVDATEDATAFTTQNLRQYQAVVFVSTTGDPLSLPAQRQAFERYIARGGGFVGIHAAADSGYDWPWYGGLVGAYFRTHPAAAKATVQVARHDTAATAALPDQWPRFDEWYDYRTNPRPDVRVLATVDESTYAGGGMGADHPIAWCHRYDGGRAVYTAMGHTIEAYSDPLFLDHLGGAIDMARGKAKFRCAPDAGNAARR